MSDVILDTTTEPLVEVTPLTFTLFPGLPLELRLMVWKFALPGPRIITVKRCIRQLAKNDWANADCGHQKVARSNAISPALLYANRESRTVALASYKPSFGSQLFKPAYFDFAHDSLFFPMASTDLESFLVHEEDILGQHTPLSDVACVQKVILGVERFTDPMINTRRLNHFKSLSSLVLTRDPHDLFEIGRFYETALKDCWAQCKSTCGHGKALNGKDVEVTTLSLNEVRQLAGRGIYGMPTKGTDG